jgi:hypothetical protein
MHKVANKKRISVAGKKYDFVKSKVREQTGLYVVSVSATHATLPLDSIICGDALQVLHTFPDEFMLISERTPMVAFIRIAMFNGSYQSLRNLSES